MEIKLDMIILLVIFFLIAFFCVRHLNIQCANFVLNSKNKYIFLICDILISFCSFLLLANYRTVVNISDNNTGYFMVYIENNGLFFKDRDILYFFDTENKLNRKIEINVRGTLSIENDNEKVIVTGENVYYFDYMGNELQATDITYKPITRIYTPFEKPIEIKCKKTFWGYEYITVEKNGKIDEVHFSKSFWIKKIIQSAFISIIIFILLLIFFIKITVYLNKLDLLNKY